MGERFVYLNIDIVETVVRFGSFSDSTEFLCKYIEHFSHNVLDSIHLLSNSFYAISNSAISGFAVNEEVLSAAISKNPILVTALNSRIGYSKAAEIAKTAYREKRAVIDVAQEMTDISRDRLEALLDPRKLTEGGMVD